MVHANYDFVVVGGGMAGVCAAIAAARHGAKTALIQDRPVLGGNASSEVRVWMVGATAMGRNRYAAETGIIGELDLINLYRNPEGNPYVWDSILLDFVVREKNLTLYLNTVVLKAEESGGRLEKILAYQMSSETWLEITGSFFADCTGDGSLGVMAGVPYMRGREAKAQFHESLAPEQADLFTLGNSLLLCSRSAGKPVKYHAPSYAYDIDYIHDLIVGNDKPLTLHTSGCDFWWLEIGGSSDTVHDADAIRFELQRLVYGIWNYIKNSGRFDADTLELEWVGSVPGKRESRRLVGSYVLTQNDILEHRDFDDAVCCGGWPIDTHPPGGIYSKKEACEQRDAGVYQIPLRCLYAGNVENLFFAGRNISASHLAFASTRVMKTCAVMGQAVGTAAALCSKWNTVPGKLDGEKLRQLQKTLLWDDQWIPNHTVMEQCTSALPGAVTASGHHCFENTALSEMHTLEQELWIQLPKLPEGSIVELWMQAGHPEIYQVELLRGNQRNACNDMTHLGYETIRLDSTAKWVAIPVRKTAGADQDLYIRIPAADAAIGISELQLCGCVGSVGQRTGLCLVNPCFRVSEDPELFAPAQLLSVQSRPTNVPNLWVSDCLDGGAAWLECDVPAGAGDAPLALQIRFDTELNRDYNQLKPDYYGNGWDKMPVSLARDFQILTDDGSGCWTPLAQIADNHQRCCYASLKSGTKRVRIEITRTWGAPYAGVFSVLFSAQSEP